MLGIPAQISVTVIKLFQRKLTFERKYKKKNFVSPTCLISCSTSFLQITICHMDDDGIDIDKSILKAILKGLKALF